MADGSFADGGWQMADGNRASRLAIRHRPSAIGAAGIHHPRSCDRRSQQEVLWLKP